MHVKETEVTQSRLLKLSLIRDMPKGWDVRWWRDLLQQLPGNLKADKGRFLKGGLD